MENATEKNIVPEQRVGKAINATSTIELASEQEAKSFFETVKKRLQDVNHWHTLAGSLSATFKLLSNDGVTEESVPKEGYFFQIDIPGPGSKVGHGYDWVKIEAMEDESSNQLESYGFTVRPSSDPNEANQEVAHFYSAESTSTFRVKRDGNRINAEVLDRNTKPNEEVETTVDKVRDKLVGAAGLTGFSKVQWQLLTDGLLSK